MREGPTDYTNRTALLKALRININAPYTVLGVGSTFLGVPDIYSDIDLRIFVSDCVQERPSPIEFNQDGVSVFARFIFRQEFIQHLASEPEYYLWCYNVDKILSRDGIGIGNSLAEARAAFPEQLPEITKRYFIEARAGLKCAQEQMQRTKHFAAALDLYRGLTALLKTVSLLHGKPFPRSKWLPDYVSELSSEAHEIVMFADQAHRSFHEGGTKFSDHVHACKCRLKNMAQYKYPQEPWTERWWENLTT